MVAQHVATVPAFGVSSRSPECATARIRSAVPSKTQKLGSSWVERAERSDSGSRIFAKGEEEEEAPRA